jgi:hypothetical protein
VSFAEPVVAEAIRSADYMIAVACGPDFKNIGPEMAFFAGNSTLQRTTLVTWADSIPRIPSYLQTAPTLVVEEHSEAELLEAIVQRLRAQPPSPSRASSVFLSYSRTDAEVADKLDKALRTAGIKVWFDQRSLVAGQEWKLEVRKAISEAALFLTLLSERSVPKRGFFQSELKFALSVADEIPAGEIFIVPVALSYKVLEMVPEALSKYHIHVIPHEYEWADASELDMLVRTIQFALGMPGSGRIASLAGSNGK